jgi:hypothetical protein
MKHKYVLVADPDGYILFKREDYLRDCYKYEVVDEFNDICKARACLKALRESSSSRLIHKYEDRTRKFIRRL